MISELRENPHDRRPYLRLQEIGRIRYSEAAFAATLLTGVPLRFGRRTGILPPPQNCIASTRTAMRLAAAIVGTWDWIELPRCTS